MIDRYRPSEKEREREKKQRIGREKEIRSQQKKKEKKTRDSREKEIRNQKKRKKEKDRQKDDKQYQALRSYPAKRSPTSTKVPKGAISKRDRLRTPPNDAVPARGGVSGSRKP